MGRFILRIVISVKVVAKSRQVRGMGKIPTANVVNISIAVVIDAFCSVGFSCILPDVVAEIFVGIVNTRVNDGDDDLLLAGA